MKRRVFSSIAFITAIGLFLVVVTQRQLIKDYYIVQTTNLQPESSALADDVGLTNQGLFLFKASQPVVQSADQFNNSCKSVSHQHSIVLGCYTRQQIYIYDINDERLTGVKQVTAAHELLHAVYERMSQSEKNELNQILTQTAESIDDEAFIETVEEYRQSDSSQVPNELHSILGTEIEVLPAKLEAHYAKFFTDRQSIVGFAKKYEQSFRTIEQSIEKFDSQLSELKSQKESLEQSLNRQQKQIEAEQARLNELRSSGNTEQYNTAVPAYNEQIQRYNASINQLKGIVAQYNSVVEQRNSLAATQNDLVKQLDSSYSPL